MRTYIICFGLLAGCNFYSSGSGHAREIILPDSGFSELGDASRDEDAGQEIADGEVQTEPKAGSWAHPTSGAGGAQAQGGSGPTSGAAAAGTGADEDSGAAGVGGAGASDAAVQVDAGDLTFEGDNDGPVPFCGACLSDAECGAGMLCLQRTICVARKPTNGLCEDVCPLTPRATTSSLGTGAYCGPLPGSENQWCDLGQDTRGRCRL
jgi:hypothetical protein